MHYFIFNIHDIESELDNRLNAKKWPFYRNTKNVEHMVQGDLVVFYQAGAGFHVFAGEAVVLETFLGPKKRYAKFSSVVKWKNKVESRISEMEVKIDHLKESFSDLQKAIVGKVGEYDRHIMEVGSEIKAMERVFSKVLPAFTENVSELSDISKRMKEVDKK